MCVNLLGERSEPVLVNSMAILFVGRAQRARTSELNGNFVCMYVCMFICHQPTAVSAHASPRNAQT